MLLGLPSADTNVVFNISIIFQSTKALVDALSQNTGLQNWFAQSIQTTGSGRKTKNPAEAGENRIFDYLRKPNDLMIAGSFA